MEEKLKALKKLLASTYQLKHTRGGHDITHFERMEKIAEKIADPGEVDIPLLKMAIWLHDIDRADSFELKTEAERINFMQKTLSDLKLEQRQIDTIIDAQLKHSKPKDSSDSMILVYLKDIDHLDMGAIGILRIAAHHRNPHYNIKDFQGKGAADADEKLESHVEDIKFCLEWENMLRTEGAKKLGKRRFAFMRQFLKELERELKELEFIS